MPRLNHQIKKLRAEMKEIGKEQRSIRKGQKKVREKLEAVESKCQELRRETKLVIQQSNNTRIRLALMLQILKARQTNDFVKATLLTQALREIIAKQNKTLELPTINYQLSEKNLRGLE
ncbi:hypothetical protein SLA2020_153440 [Shorea laevis]